jgi:hypothetical protein
MKITHLFFLSLFIVAFCCFSCEELNKIINNNEEEIETAIYPKVIETVNYTLPDSINNEWCRPHWSIIPVHGAGIQNYA